MLDWFTFSLRKKRTNQADQNNSFNYDTNFLQTVQRESVVFEIKQGFAQVLRTWGGGGGGSSKFDGGGGLKSKHEGEHGGRLKCCQKIPVKEFI